MPIKIEERLESLERKYRRLLFAGGGLAALLVVVLLLGAMVAVQNVKDEVRAREFVLVDENQKPRAALRLSEDGRPSLNLLDKNGNRIWYATR